MKNERVPVSAVKRRAYPSCILQAEQSTISECGCNYSGFDRHFDMRASREQRKQATHQPHRAPPALSASSCDQPTLSPSGAGEFERRPTSFEARLLVREIAESFDVSGLQTGVEIRLVLPAKPVFAMADAVGISQVLVNLINYAVKSNHQGAVIVELEPSVDGFDVLLFHVTDACPGVPPVPAASTFESRGPTGNTGEIRGNLAVGLKVVRSLVSDLGGTLTIHRQADAGTRLTLEVPAVIESPDSVYGQYCKPNKVLVVGFPGNDRSHVRSLVLSLGRDCRTADSASAAANYIASTAYDAVLIDLDMPGRSGYSLAAETRRVEGPNRTGRLVAMTTLLPNKLLNPWPFDRVVAKRIDQVQLADVLEPRSPPTPR